MGNEYEKHKERCRRYHKTEKGYISQKARTEAIKLLIKKHRKDFDKLVNNLKKEIAEEFKK